MSASGSRPTLAERLDALETALKLSQEHLEPERLARAHAVVAKSRKRVGHGTEHTVVALAGSTGVGKSSLFNALVGDDVSVVGVRRPTTAAAHAAVFGERGDALLDWLGVGRRHHVAGASDGVRTVDTLERWPGLVLIDLPDFDSTEADNRDEVDRLVELVDAMVWVTDPQKYADEALHHRYVRPLASHADVVSFVVNKIDVVPEAQRERLVTDFARRLRDDGIPEPRILVTSVSAAEGLDGLALLFDETIELRRVVVDRLVADLREAGTALISGGSTSGVTKEVRRDLTARLGHAAGADEAGEIVAAQHRKDARMVLGWPPIKFVERFRRRHPISDLPRASVSTVARSEIDLALRDAAESVASDLDPPWPSVLRGIAAERADDLASRLTSVTQTSARDATEPPGWWSPVQALQRFVTLVAAVGALWLLAAAVLGGFFQLDTDPLLIDTPGWEWIPLPSLLVLGGLLVGLLIAFAVRWPVAIAASRRSRSVRHQLRKQVQVIAEETVVADLERAIADRAAVADALAIVTAP